MYDQRENKAINSLLCYCIWRSSLNVEYTFYFLLLGGQENQTVCFMFPIRNIFCIGQSPPKLDTPLFDPKMAKEAEMVDTELVDVQTVF